MRVLSSRAAPDANEGALGGGDEEGRRSAGKRIEKEDGEREIGRENKEILVILKS